MAFNFLVNCPNMFRPPENGGTVLKRAAILIHKCHVIVKPFKLKLKTLHFDQTLIVLFQIHLKRQNEKNSVMVSILLDQTVDGRNRGYL